jgi:tetratricopeptide (TPR) repeat protein
VSFANSGAPAAQQAFLTGLAQLHNFEYEDAARWFRQAEQADARFALAYWGEAMTFNHPVWMEQNIAQARAALKRLADSSDRRIASAGSDREKAYMRAVEILYGDGDKNTRDIAYADAMADLYRAYPDDVEATAFYALALLGTAHDGRDVPTYIQAAALLEPLVPTHPNHPGIAHYLIHAYDDPTHAPLGLRAARAYSRIAPNAAHAQHMCSHIFIATGMWDDLVDANETAIALVDRERGSRGRPPSACGHYPSWLQYGYLQQGRFAAAKQLLATCRAVPRPASSPSTPGPVAPDKLAIDSFVTMRARYLLDTEDWTSDVMAWSVPTVGRHDAELLAAFVDGYAGVKRSRRQDAAEALDRLRAARAALDRDMQMQPPPDGTANAARGWARILDLQLSAVIQHANGNGTRAIEQLREAATLEDRLPYEFGPPFIDKPSYELLGEVLLQDSEAKLALDVFERALARTPDRPAALLGLMRAAEQTGDARKAATAKSKLRIIWHRADRVPIDLQ